MDHWLSFPNKTDIMKPLNGEMKQKNYLISYGSLKKKRKKKKEETNKERKNYQRYKRKSKGK